MMINTRWPLLILALLTGFLLFSLWSFHRAAQGGSAVTDRDYYSHGLRYNQTLLERQAAASLGWQAATKLQGKLVTIQLHDSDRQVVAGAVGSLILLGPGPLHNHPLVLREGPPGSYGAELPAGVHGELPAEITFQRDGAQLSQRLLFAIR